MADQQFNLSGDTFKREETTKDLILQFKSDNGNYINPDTTHNWIAKIGNASGFLGDYPVEILGNQIKVNSSEFEDLPADNYVLEIWETWTDNGKVQRTIYPSPGEYVHFTIEQNITDSKGEVAKTISIDKIVADIAEKTTQNVSIDKVIMGAPGTDPDVSKTATESGVVYTLTLPAGQPGKDAQQPDFSISAKSLAPDEQATATITPNEDKTKFSIKVGIPKGDKGDAGPQGDPGLTPQIDSNGHWKIGSTITQYSVGMKDQDDSATLLDLNTDKAVYYPSEKVVFHATSVSGHGHLVVKYYHLNNLVATKEVYYGTSEISWSWFLPADDNIGYAVVIENHVGNNVSTETIAINVSNDVYNFPIMGFISRYDNDSPTEIKGVLDYLKRLHINLIQCYDWFDYHSLPLPTYSNGGDSLYVANIWNDMGNRLTKKKVIEDYCYLAKSYGMKPLAYMAMNGSDTNQLVHGLSADMFLYDDNSKSLDHVYKTLDKSKGWGKYNLYNMNWMSGSWQDYIYHQMETVRNNMPFVGWHIDMFGDPGTKYEADGNPISSATLADGIHYFLNKAGKLGWDIGVNSVSEYGLTDIRNSNVPKYLYTEVWDNRKTYNDLFNLVKFLTESRDSNKVKKGVIIAAYMDYNYAKSNQGKNFNDDGIILTDLVIMASGGMHLEMGEHLLDNEYFPNNNLNMSDSLKNTYLPEMYDFFTAFKEIIGQGYQVDGLATIDGGSVDTLVAGKVCGISRGNDKGYLGLSLINMQTNGDQWSDTDANRTITKPVGNVKVNLKLGVTNHDWYLFNLENLTPQKLNVGADGVVNVSDLGYYSFILGVPTAQSAAGSATEGA